MFTDTEEPQVNCNVNQTFLTNEDNNAVIVIWDNPTASDNSGKVTVTCDPSSGSTFPTGHTQVMCEAVDVNGNRAECSFQVNVVDN